MLSERDVVFNERLEVCSVLRDVTHDILSVSGMRVIVTIQLVCQRPKQTVTIPDHLPYLEAHRL